MPTLGAIARAWGRIGVVGFGGPPAHIALLRELVVDRRRWMSSEQFEDGLAAVNLLPGPASTQLAIYTAWRTRGLAGALVGGLSFVVPGLVLIVALAAIFLSSPPDWIRGAGAGAGAAVAAVALHAGLGLLRPAWERVASAVRWRFVVYALRRRHGGCNARTVARRGVAGVRCSRARLAPPGEWQHRLVRAVPGTRRRNRHWRHARLARLGCVQGRRTLLRRGLRDRPAHAGRRGRALRLDDRLRVPERRRPGTGHPGTRHAYGRSGRLRAQRGFRARSSLRSSRLHPRSRSSSSARGASIASSRTSTFAASSTAPDLPAIGADSRIGRPARARCSRSDGRSRCSRVPRVSLFLLRRGVVPTLLAAGAVGAVAVLLGASSRVATSRRCPARP